MLSTYKKFYFGTQIRITNSNMIDVAKKVKNVGCNFMQIFLSSQKIVHKRSEKELNDFKIYLKNNDMKIIVHASYLYNMAADWDKYTWWIINLELEIQYAHQIGAMGIVLHLGYQLNLPRWKAINNIYTSLIYIHNQTLISRL